MYQPTVRYAVFTESGMRVGTVLDVAWDTTSFVITHFKVRRSIIHREIFLIHASQVVRIDGDKLIVQDAVMSALSKHVASAKKVEGRSRQAATPRRIE